MKMKIMNDGDDDDNEFEDEDEVDDDKDDLHAEVAQQADALLVDCKPQFRTFN